MNILKPQNLQMKELEKGNISILKEDEKLDYYYFDNQ